MAQFLALVRRDYTRFSEADFTPLLDAEALRVRVLYAEGTIRQIFGRKDVPGAVIVLEADDLAGATAAVASLPLAQRRMLTVEILEVGPYRGFVPPATGR